MTVSIQSLALSEWRQLYRLYRKTFHADPCSEDYFFKYLICYPNFSFRQVFTLGTPARAAAIAWRDRLPRDPWDCNYLKTDYGYVVVLGACSPDDFSAVLNPALAYLRKDGVRSVQFAFPGHAMFPTGVREEDNPDLYKNILAAGFTVQGGSYSMARELAGIQTPEEVAVRRDALAKEGIYARTPDREDALRSIRFLQNAGLNNWTWNVHQKIMQNKLEEAVVIGTDTEILGYCQYNYCSETPDRVGPLGVSPACRGKGIGAVMVDCLLHTMASRSFPRALFYTCREDLRGFFCKNGFEIFRAKDVFMLDL